MKAWFFRTLGNMAWDLLRYKIQRFITEDSVGEFESSRRYRLAIWAWAKAWEAEEQAAGRIPIRFRQHRWWFPQ